MFDIQSRRDFIRSALLAGVTTPLVPTLFNREVRAEEKSPNEKLKIGVIGVANRGGDNLNGVSGEEITVLCDIDSRNLAGAAARFPKAHTCDDYRRVFDYELDALVVSTPDHMHAIPALEGLNRGWPVYCEKPLAHSVHEVRAMRTAASKNKCITQMGTQIHAGDNYRRCVEIVQAGVIGPVHRVHVWLGGGVRPGQRVKEATPPKEVNYDLWLGPAPYRPYHESHFHFNWRFWWDFGGGALADFGCHYMDLPFWALGLSFPDKVSAKGEKAYEGDNDVPSSMQVDYHFPADEKNPEIELTWYHGNWRPEGAEQYQLGSAVLFEGEKGRLLADYGSRKIFLKDGKEADLVEMTIPNSIGHHEEWLHAIRTKGKTTCNFEYSGTLAEAVLLGNVAYRTEEPLEWDAETLTATNTKKAAQFVQREYRKGWKLPV